MFIVTQRLFLRPAWPEDAAALHAAVGAWEIARNLARLPWPYRMADAQHFCTAGLSGEGTDLLIWTRDGRTPDLVGGIGLRVADGTTELGYWIAAARQRRGYATEAGQAMLSLAFDGLRLPQIAAGHFADNPASGKVLRRLGFEPTGQVVDSFCASRNRQLPTVEYRLARGVWQCQPPAQLAA